MTSSSPNDVIPYLPAGGDHLADGALDASQEVLVIHRVNLHIPVVQVEPQQLSRHGGRHGYRQIQADRQTDRQTADRQTDGVTDGRTDGDRQRDRQAGGEIRRQ